MVLPQFTTASPSNKSTTPPMASAPKNGYDPNFPNFEQWQKNKDAGRSGPDNGGAGAETVSKLLSKDVKSILNSNEATAGATALSGVIDGDGSGKSIGSAIGGGAGMLLGPLGSVTGGLIGGILGGLFGGEEESPEEIARRRIDAYTGKMAGLRDSETRRVGEEMSRGTSSAMRQAANIAGRQAGALGKTEQTASFALPATTNIAVAGGRQLRGAVSNIQSSYNRSIAEAEGGMFGVPATESTSDVLANMGEAFSARGSQEDYFTRLEKIMKSRDEALAAIGRNRG
jgi:hypothetical protein